MFVPEPFKEDRIEVLHDAIRAARLAALVTIGADGMTASHVPVLLEPQVGRHGTLVGHISRANGQWKTASAETPALAIFTGPDAYISPSWYPSKREAGKVVPTWNYVAVHAYGPIAWIDKADALREIVTRLTERHEAGRDEPWAVSDAPDDFVRQMLRGIVGFRLTIERLEGKWKMSQNRNQADRKGAADGLRREATPEADEVADLIPLAPER